MKVSSGLGIAPSSVHGAGKLAVNADRVLASPESFVMDFGILGPLEVRSDTRALSLGGVRERSLLAVLLMNANELVPTDRLVDELWGEDLPKTAVKTVHVYISRLRKLLGPDTIVTRAPGYLLRVDSEQIDAHRFERLAGEGREALAMGDASAATRLLGDALALWRGAPLSDFAYEPFAQAEAARLQELRLEALEDRLEADLRCGKATELVAELQALSARHPLRERLRGQLMLALYRSGRQAEALDVYRDARMTLVEELGIEPSRALKDLERAMLSPGPRARAPACADGRCRAGRVRRPRGGASRAAGCASRCARRPRGCIPDLRRARHRQEPSRRRADSTRARRRDAGSARSLLGVRRRACLLAVGAGPARLHARR